LRLILKVFSVVNSATDNADMLRPCENWPSPFDVAQDERVSISVAMSANHSRAFDAAPQDKPIACLRVCTGRPRDRRAH